MGEDEGEDGVRGGDEGGEKRSVVGEDGRGGERGGEGKDVVFGDLRYVTISKSNWCDRMWAGTL